MGQSGGFPKGFRRVSEGFPEGFRGFPEGHRGFPALEYVFRPYETKVQANENFRPSALIKIIEMLKHRNPGWPALGACLYPRPPLAYYPRPPLAYFLLLEFYPDTVTRRRPLEPSDRADRSSRPIEPARAERSSRPFEPTARADRLSLPIEPTADADLASRLEATWRAWLDV